MSDPKDVFKRELEDALRKVAPGVAVEVHVERPKNPEHGDLSSNVAMQLARQLKRNPREIAQKFLEAAAGQSPAIESLTIAGAGFLNARFKSGAKLEIIRRVLREGAGFGRIQLRNSETVQVEFVSANPTGPLHVGHGRQAALGDSIAALLEAQGHAVTREFYYNDAGAQIDKLTWSVQARARLRKELSKDVERGRRSLIVSFLEVLDNLDRALEAVPPSVAAGDPFVAGVAIVRQQFLTTLESMGVKRLDPMGQPFDPARHEAVSSVPVQPGAAPNTVVGVIRPGYMIGDEVLRPAGVAVSG